MRTRAPADAAHLALLALLVAVTILVTPGQAAPAGAQDGSRQGPAPTSEPVETPGIIPEPNAGTEPHDPGDRGGLLQTGLFALIVVAIVFIGAFIVRESRKARERRGF